MKTKTSQPVKTEKGTAVRITAFFFISIISASFILHSCSGTEENSPEEIRKAISEHRQQIGRLEREITSLEGKLEEMGEATDIRSGTRVRVKEMEKSEFVSYFIVNGSVEAVQEAIISPETNGQVKSIPVNRGDRVQAGSIVARLNTSVIENNIEEVKTNLRLAETFYERQKALWEQGVGSEIQYLEARSSYESLRSRLNSLESQLEMAVLKAPFSGIVDEIFLKEGELAMPGNAVMQIINLEKLFINSEVSEKYLPLLDPQDSVFLRFPSFPGYESKELIHRKGNVINPENRTFRLQLLIDNPDEKFKPNMVARLAIRSFTERNALVVPTILVRQDARGHYLFTARKEENGRYFAHRTYITRGAEGEGRTVVETGLEPGDLLISEGHNRISEGTPVLIESE